MNTRKHVWGWIFMVSVALVAALTADILLNNAELLTALYRQLVEFAPATVLYSAMLTLPVIAIISGIQFLRYFVKSRKAHNNAA